MIGADSERHERYMRAVNPPAGRPPTITCTVEADTAESARQLAVDNFARFLGADRPTYVVEMTDATDAVHTADGVVLTWRCTFVARPPT